MEERYEVDINTINNNFNGGLPAAEIAAAIGILAVDCWLLAARITVPQ